MEKPPVVINIKYDCLIKELHIHSASTGIATDVEQAVERAMAKVLQGIEGIPKIVQSQS